MKNIVFVFALLSLAGCMGGSHNLITSTVDQVITTDVAGEYLIQARDTTPFVSSEKTAEENAIKVAMEYCTQLGQEYKKKYAITTPKAMQKWADATLHFRCIDKK
jgi:hypothetical protein